MSTAADKKSGLLSLIYASGGHTLMHLMAAFYFVIVLAIEKEWGLPYSDLIELWSLGALLIGLGAIPAGWLADRWSAAGMMAVMFFGLGAASFVCANATTPTSMMIGLAMIGLFASIYHPVGIAWVVRNAERRGKALGLNGLFGSLGIAGSGLVSGLLIDLYGWRSAFYVPGVVSLGFGISLVYFLMRGEIIDSESDKVEDPPTSRHDMLRAFGLMLISIFCMGIAFNAVQTALPKVFDVRLGDVIGEGTLGVGVLIAGVYLLAAGMQIVGGHLADRFPLKTVYVFGLLVQVPALCWVAWATGVPVVVAATMAVILNNTALPAENVLVARFSPGNRRGLAYGLKFVIALGTAPIAVMLVSQVVQRTGEFVWLFLILGSLVAVAVSVSTRLPIRWREVPANASASVSV